jgi:carbon storage regulator
MLVLSRRVGERLVIGDDIVITVIDVRSDGVRIGIEAPRDVRINRAEVLEAVKQANVEAAAADDDAVEALRALRPPVPGATPGSTTRGSTTPGTPTDPATPDA